MPTLLRLTDQERANLRILYLAPFAPDLGAPPPALHAKVGVRPQYHYEIHRILCDLGVPVTSCRDLDRIGDLVPHHDYVFSLFSRAAFRNCEIYVPAVCERLRVPCMGAPPNIRALAEDKYVSKAFAAFVGVPVMPGMAYARIEDLDRPPGFAGPYFIKYRFGSASEDVALDCVQPEWPGARARVRDFLDRGKECLVERLIAGSDVTVPVLGGDTPIVLPAVEEISDLPYGIATFEQKRFLKESRRRRIVADAVLAERLNTLATALVRQIQPFDYVRIDFRLEQDTGALFLLEFNIACNIGSTAAIMFSAGAAGISQVELVEHVLCHSLRRQAHLGRPLETVNV